MAELLLQMEGITKIFKENGVKAVDSANFSVGHNEIHAIVGENGAGKSSLMHILAGELHPDAGGIIFENSKVQFKSPSDALRKGIGLLHQHLQLIQELTVLENIILGFEPSTKLGFLKREEAIKRINNLCIEYNLLIDPDKTVSSLTADEKQKTALLSILFHNVKLLILDEPTTFFSESEIDAVHSLISKLKKLGKSIIIITHKLKEAVKIADRITVMKEGKIIYQVNGPNTDTDQLAKIIFGKMISTPFTKIKTAPGKTILEAKGLTFKGRGNKYFEIDFKVRQREILVVTGIRENGLETLEKILAGQIKPSSGNLYYKNTILKPEKYSLRKLNAGYIPSDRIKTGTSIKSSISDNIILLKYKLFVKWGLLNSKKIRNYSEKLIDKYSINGTQEQPISTLSGGNIQRVMIAREIEAKPELFIFAEPSRGLDIKSKKLIYERIHNLKENGTAILIISSDIEEAIQMADRLIIMYMGKIAASLDNQNINKSYIGKLMLGLEN